MIGECIGIIGRGARGISRAGRLLYRDPRSMLLVMRMAAWVVAFSLLVKILPLPRALRIIAPRRDGGVTNGHAIPEAKLVQFVDSLLGANLLVFTPTCWKRAAVLHRYLALNGIRTRIVFGVRREGEGMLEGHAWLEADGKPLFENSAVDFVATYSFPS